MATPVQPRLQKRDTADAFSDAFRETISSNRSPGSSLQPDQHCESILLINAPGRGTYTGTMYLMEDTTGKRSLDWIEKCWATLEEASFTRELDLYMKAQANKPLSCKPTSVQAWSTEESLYLAMKPPHPIGWRAAIHTLPKAKGRILDAYNLLFAHGVLRGYANLVDILIGDDGKVIIVTFMEAATTGHRRIGIPSCDNRDRELERHCVSTILLDAGNRQVDEETGSKQGIPRQITRKDLYLQLQRGPKPADMSGPFAFFLSFPSYRSAARDTQPAPPALYATQTGLIEPELPQTRKGVRFGHGTMDNYIWNCAKEHSVSPLLRRAEIKKTKERQGNKKQRRATSQGNMPANSRPSPSTSELDHPSLIAQLVVHPPSTSSGPYPRTLADRPSSQATLYVPQLRSQYQAPPSRTETTFGSPGPSLTYQEPPPARDYITTKEEGVPQGVLTIVITSPTGQQHVWSASSHVLNNINMFLSKLGARRSRAAPQAAPIAQKRKAKDTGRGQSGSKRRSSQFEPRQELRMPKMGGVCRQPGQDAAQNTKEMERQTQSKVVSLEERVTAAHKVRVGSHAGESILKRKAEANKSDGSKKLRTKG